MERNCSFLPGGSGRRLGRRRAVLDHHVADDRDRPARRRVRRGAVEALDGQLLAEDAHLLLRLRNRRSRPTRCRSAPPPSRRRARRRRRCDRPGRSAVPELALHDRPADQRVVHRQHADRRRVAREGAVGLHLLFGIGVAVVQVERQRDRTAVRRQPDRGCRRRDRGRSCTSQKLSLRRSRRRRAASGTSSSARLFLSGRRRGGGAAVWRRRQACASVPCAGQRQQRQASIDRDTATQIDRMCQPISPRPCMRGSAHVARAHGSRTPLRSLISSRNSIRVRASVAERAEHRARHGKRVLLLDAAHRHAQVRRFHRRPRRRAARSSREWCRRSGSSAAPAPAAAG